MRERPYYDLERVVLLLQTQSPAHHFTPTHQDEAKENGVGARRSYLQPGDLPRSLLGPSVLLLTRWTPVLPEELRLPAPPVLG